MLPCGCHRASTRVTSGVLPTCHRAQLVTGGCLLYSLSPLSIYKSLQTLWLFIVWNLDCLRSKKWFFNAQLPMPKFGSRRRVFFIGLRIHIILQIRHLNGPPLQSHQVDGQLEGSQTHMPGVCAPLNLPPPQWKRGCPNGSAGCCDFQKKKTVRSRSCAKEQANYQLHMK